MGLATDGFLPFQGFIRLWYLTTIASRQDQGFISQATTNAFLLTNPRHKLLSCTILLACLTSKPLFFKQSFKVSIHLSATYLPTSTLCYIDPLSNPIILHSLNMSEPSENTFINLFFYNLRHLAQLPYPCIRDFIHSPDTQQNSEVVHLHSPNTRPLLFPPYHCITTIRKNRHQQ